MFEPEQAAGEAEAAEETALAVPEEADKSELDEKLEALAEELDDDSWKVRKQALQEIRAMAHDAKDLASTVVEMCLEDRDFDVRNLARKTLVAMGPAAAVEVTPRLHEALQCKDSETRKVGDEAAMMFRAFPPESAALMTPVLIRLLKGANWREAEAVGQAILDLGTEEVARATPRLLELLESPEKRDRANAAHAFGRFQHWAAPEVTTALAAALDGDQDYWVREAAMKAKQRIAGEFDYDVRNNVTQAAPGAI